MANNEVSVETGDQQYLALAREIAMDIHPLETILKNLQISTETWEVIQHSPTFQRYLKSEAESWETAINTQERVKIKAAAMVEQWMPELYRRLVDRSESLAAKIEGGKLVARLAGMGLDKANIQGMSGEKFTIQINLGGDSKLTFQKELPAKVIDAEVIEG